MNSLEPSLKIRRLVIRCIRPPLIWDMLDKINDEVIALEVQNEDLRQANYDLVQRMNDVDLNEALDALQNLHSGNERYDRSQRIKLLIKHGRIKEAE